MSGKALYWEDLIQHVDEEQNVSFINYWKTASESLVNDYIKRYEIKSGCSNECKVCQISHIEKYRDRYPNRPSDSISDRRTSGGIKPYTHAFQVKCGLIPENYESTIPELIRESLSPEDVKSTIEVRDPVAFARRYFGWVPRKHQEVMLRCSAKKKVYRIGRRGGKSEAMAVEMLWHAITKTTIVVNPETGEEREEGLKIVVVAPFDSQIVSIFEIMLRLIGRSPEIQDAVAKFRKEPHHHLEFKNKCTIKGFTTGSENAASIRGQDANILVLDECDYLTDEEYKAVIPLMNSHPNVLVRAASTPKGKRERYYQWCQTAPQWKEFYFPTPIIDMTPKEQIGMTWKQMRYEMRPEYSTDEWLQEVMAIFIASAAGVYQPGFVTAAMKDYLYREMTDALIGGGLQGWKYSIGVDWNSDVGTEICITGHNPMIGFRVMDMINVPKQDFTQYAGLTKITELIQLWQPKYVYVDAGYGSTNYEMLRLWANKFSPGSYERSMEENIKKFDFGSKIELRDPVDGSIVKHAAKSYMVENSVRKFEDRVVSFSKEDEKLRKQLLNYIITNRTEAGKPIYGFENKKIGDHALDAFNLSLVAWAIEEGIMSATQNVGVTKVGIVGTPMHQEVAKTHSKDKPVYFAKGARESLLMNVAERSEAMSRRNDKITGEDRIVSEKTSRPGFLNDTEHLEMATHRQKQLVKNVRTRQSKLSGRSNI